jgi:hypothetical protein
MSSSTMPPNDRDGTFAFSVAVWVAIDTSDHKLPSAFISYPRSSSAALDQRAFPKRLHVAVVYMIMLIFLLDA